MFRSLAVTFAVTSLSVSTSFAGTVDTAQRLLNQLGYNAGAVDGAYGKKTRGALEAFYADNGGSFDGKLDANEVADLKAATISAGLDVGDKNSVGGRMPGAGTVAVQNPHQGGAFYPEKFKVNGKYYLPAYGTAPNMPGQSWSDQMGNWLNDFYRIADFDGDGDLDWFVSSAHEPKGFKQRENMSGGADGTGAYMCYTTRNGTCEADKHMYDIVTTDKGFVGNPTHGKFTQHIATDRLIKDSWDIKQQGPGPTVVADFNGDGRPDFYQGSAIRGTDGTMDGGFHGYFLSQPNGTLVESSREMISGAEFNKKVGRIEDFSHRVDSGDLDGDGDIDILLTSWDWTPGPGGSHDWKNGNGKVTCLWNDGKGRMTSKTCGNQFGMNVKHGDFNGDGHIDLIMGNASYDCALFDRRRLSNGHQRSKMRVAFGDGSGKWHTKRSVTINDLGVHQHRSDVRVPLCSMPTSRVWDWDNDGDLDILGNAVGHNYAGGYWVLLDNDGYGNFYVKFQIAAGGRDVHVPKNWTKPRHFPKAEIGHGLSQYCTSPILLDFNSDGFMDFYCMAHADSPANNKMWINEQGNGFRLITGPEQFKFTKLF